MKMNSRIAWKLAALMGIFLAASEMKASEKREKIELIVSSTGKIKLTPLKKVFTNASLILSVVAPDTVNDPLAGCAYYLSGKGGSVKGGLGVEASAKIHRSFDKKIEEYVMTEVRKQLEDVSKSKTSGSFASRGSTKVLGLRDSWSVLGSYSLDATYFVEWKASSWKKNKRTVNAEVSMLLKYNDKWDFDLNESYNELENAIHEKIPDAICRFSFQGKPKSFQLTGSFGHTEDVKITQYK